MQFPIFPIRLFLCLLCVSAVSATRGDQEEASASDTKPEKAKPKMVTVTGVFEAIHVHKLSADTKEIQSLKIKKILPHGTSVTKDQNVVWFETEDVDKQIRDATAAHRLAELTFKDEEFAYRQFLETQKLEKATADRNHQKARQDFDNYVQVDRERQIESARFSLKNSQASLDNAMEELTQLEQMYKEDDLTEESEEIVLKRAKQSVENAQFRLKGTKISTERSLRQTIPRSRAEQQDAFTRAQLAHDKATRDLNVARQKRDIEMQQKRDKFKEAEEKFRRLQEERKQLVIQAPQAGIVMHGTLARGKIGDKPSTLDEGVSVTGKQVLVTIAQPGRLQIRVDLQEKDLRHVTVGAKGKVKATAYPDRNISATVKSVSAVPYAGNKYDCVLSVKLPKAAGPAILPGMSCSIEFPAK